MGWVCIGVFGGWGSGKTTSLALLAEELKVIPNARIIYFNSWKYAGLMEVLPSLIYKILQQGVPDSKEKRNQAALKVLSSLGKEYSDKFGKWAEERIGINPVELFKDVHKLGTIVAEGRKIVPPDVMNAYYTQVDRAQDALGVLSSRLHVVYALAAGSWLGVGNDPVYAKTRCFDPFPFPVCDEAAKARIRALGEELDAHRKRVQAQHPADSTGPRPAGLSLTAMYNVLEALRAGRALTAKEQAVHDAGFVSVLRQLHDELDAAVAAAYGWEDLWHWLAEAHSGSFHNFKTGEDAQGTLTESGFNAATAAWEREFDGEILLRLVALNAARAAEEAAGTIRWLRPEYQAGGAGAPRTLQSTLTMGTTGKIGKGNARRSARSTGTAHPKAPWPKSLAERVRATELALQASPAPVTPADLAKRFSRAKPEDLAEILETLATLGRAHRDGSLYSS